MSILASPTAGPGPGWWFGRHTIDIRNVTGTAFVLGAMVQLDMLMSDADVLNLVMGDEDSALACAILPVQATLDGNNFTVIGAVEEGPIAANGSGRICVWGPTRAVSSGTAIVPGGRLTLTTTGLVVAAAASDMIVGCDRRVKGAGNNANGELIPIYLNGFRGLFSTREV